LPHRSLSSWGTWNICARLKARDVREAYTRFQATAWSRSGRWNRTRPGEPGFFVRDPGGNLLQVTGGTAGSSAPDAALHPPGGYAARCRVTRAEPALALSGQSWATTACVRPEERVFPTWQDLPGGSGRAAVLLAHSEARRGAFSQMLGPSRLELVQCLERAPRKIYAGRFWGDLGFIHLCFDVRGMEGLKRRCGQAGFPFTVDSAQAFVMGEASGRFAYVEDPDGTLVEFVRPTAWRCCAASAGIWTCGAAAESGFRVGCWPLSGLNRVRP